MPLAVFGSAFANPIAQYRKRDECRKRCVKSRWLKCSYLVQDCYSDLSQLLLRRTLALL